MVDEQIASPLARIRHGEHIVPEEFVLQAHIEVVIARSLKILIHRESIKGRRTRGIGPIQRAA